MLLSSKLIKTIKSFKLCVLPNDFMEDSQERRDSSSNPNDATKPIVDWWGCHSALANLASFLCEYCNV